MSILRTVLTVLVAMPLLAQPAFAEKNNGAFARSSDAAKMKMMTCQVLKSELDRNEREADRHSGTKEAAPYSKAADDAYELGHITGCSWAA